MPPGLLCSRRPFMSNNVLRIMALRTFAWIPALCVCCTAAGWHPLQACHSVKAQRPSKVITNQPTRWTYWSCAGEAVQLAMCGAACPRPHLQGAQQPRDERALVSGLAVRGQCWRQGPGRVPVEGNLGGEESRHGLLESPLGCARQPRGGVWASRRCCGPSSVPSQMRES